MAPRAKPAAESSKKRKSPEKEIPKISSLEEWKPLQLSEREPQLNLPPNLDMSNPYSLFNLFFIEEIFEKISNSTNIYTQL